MVMLSEDKLTGRRSGVTMSSLVLELVTLRCNSLKTTTFLQSLKGGFLGINCSSLSVHFDLQNVGLHRVSH